MTCLGLPLAPCSTLLVLSQKLQVPLSFVGRLGITGTIIALAFLLLLRALGAPVVDMPHAMFPPRTDPWRDDLMRF